MNAPTKLAAPAKKRAAPAMDTDPILRMLAGTGFYKGSWGKMLNSNMALGVALVLSISGNIGQYLMRPSPVYFATTEGGRLVRIAPVSDPYVNTETVLQKAQKTAVSSFSLDFDDINLKAKLSALRSDFTRDGYASLMDQYERSGLIEKVRTRSLVSSAVATGAGVVVNDYVGSDGLYTWEVEIPVAITLTGQAERKTYDYLVKQTVKRVPVVDNPAGIATHSMRLGGNAKIN